MALLSDTTGGFYLRMKNDRVELFSDYFAQTSNVFTTIDARIKLIFILSSLSLVLVINKLQVLLLITVLCIGILLTARIPITIVLMRVVGLLAMVIVTILIQSIFHGETPVYIISLGPIKISFFKEGFSKGLLIGARALSGTSLIILLSMTTPLNKILGALKCFRVPDVWLSILAFSYRYIFVFIEEAQNVMSAQRLRLGYNGLIKSLRSWGTLVGSLFVKVYDQAIATHDAMVLRGYSGTIHIEKPGHVTQLDVKAGLIMAIVFIFLMLVAYCWG